MSRLRLGRQVAGRIVSALIMLCLLSVVVYAGVDALPGDPVTSRLGGTVSPDQIAEAQARLGLDRPLPERYSDWATGLLGGDLGTSATGAPVAGVVGDRLRNTAQLVAVTLALLVPSSLLLGVALGKRAGTRSDFLGTTLLLLTSAIPEFVMTGLLVLILAVGLGWLPAVSLVPAGDSPLAHPTALVLPVLALLLAGLAYSSRIIRAATATAERSPHVEFLRLNGISERVVVRQAILPAVLPTAVQVWLVSAAVLLGGTVLVEKILAYPGVGPVLVDAVRTGDLPVVQALAMIFGATTLAAMMLADLTGSVLDPRRSRS